MKRCLLLLLFSTILFPAKSVCGEENNTASSTEKTVDFKKQILPIFQAKCLDCHDENTQESKFRLDRKSALLQGGDSGEPAIILGDSQQSHLMKLVRGEEPDHVMPPDEDERLSSTQIQLLKMWIDQGANWPGPNGIVTQEKKKSDHWSFQPLKKIKPPVITGDDAKWIANGIDAFIIRKLHQKQIPHNNMADRRTLIRRIYLDILGLPPTPEQVQRFLDDDSPDAYQKLVDKTLSSPHYGERWARHWLDLVRFAETHGFETNRERPNAWPYRDYVIQSFNDDKPYDQFIKEQIAGDSFGSTIGTGYLVAGPYDLVKSPDINLTLMQRHNELDDMINTTGTAFLGLTLGCARCHNHKFDPITQTDYYSLQAIFAGVKHGDRNLPVPESRQKELERTVKQIAKLQLELEKYRPSKEKPTKLVESSGKNPLREPVQSIHNVERFVPTQAKFVRFTIRATNSSEPCLDELQIFTGNENVALAKTGAVATCSSSLPGYAIHQLKHINDGKFGNSHSWISHQNGAGWVQIELPKLSFIDRIEWGRDREGRYTDRLAVDYVIEVSRDKKQWKTVASSKDRLPFALSKPKSKTKSATYSFEHLSGEQAKAAKRLLSELQKSQKKLKSLQNGPKVYAGQFVQPGPTHRLYRGEPLAKREQVSPDAPEIFTELNLKTDSPEAERRKRLAEWIASPDNPLTPRVIVNRIWQFHFGQGFVTTPSDFGSGGVPPTHPELLDWLAGELISHHWSLKHIHRLILNSATYQQSGKPSKQAMQIDAASQYWWRFPARRLAAEPIRDSILAVSGSLNLQAGGPGFSAFEVDAENVRHYHPKSSYSSEDFRRMIYMTKVRMEQDSVFGLFDCPDAASSVAKRSRSTTPLQAMNLFNSTFLLQQADLFAKRLKKEKPNVLTDQINLAYQLCYSRSPTQTEQEDAGKFITQYQLQAFCRAILNSNEFLFLQ